VIDLPAVVAALLQGTALALLKLTPFWSELRVSLVGFG